MLETCPKCTEPEHVKAINEVLLMEIKILKVALFTACDGDTKKMEEFLLKARTHFK